MIHTIDRDKRFGGRSQRINSPSSMRKAEDYIKKENAVDTDTGEIIEKTNQSLWFSSTGKINDFARQCMTLQKQQGYIFKKGDKRLMVHQIQSFDARDNIKNGGKLTPELAHELGVKLAEKMYPNYQFLVVTHYNTEHIHNHILINGVANPSINQDGFMQRQHKFQDGNNAHRHENEYSLIEVKQMDESLCKQYNLTYSSTCYHDKKSKPDNVNSLTSTTTEKFIKTPALENYRAFIDKAINMCKHFDIKEFRKILSKTYCITSKIDNSRNSITYSSTIENRIKKVSGAKLGQGYRLEDINERLRNLKERKINTEIERSGTRSIGLVTNDNESRIDSVNSSAEFIRRNFTIRKADNITKQIEYGEPYTNKRKSEPTDTNIKFGSSVEGISDSKGTFTKERKGNNQKHTIR